jgi:GT2 family glycosyltransferase
VYDHERQVFSASGTACLWVRDVFLSLGGYDESFFAYYEDVDLGFRARRAGHECWYAPRAVALHRGSSTAAASWREFETYYAVRNRWRMVLKNASSRWLVANAPWIVAGEVATAARSLALGDGRRLGRAYRDAVAGIGAKRREARRQGSDDELGRLVRRAFPPLAVSLRRHRAARTLRERGRQA